MTTRIARRGVSVQPGSKLEFYAWLFMRISGLVLALMATFHFLYMHFYLHVDSINYAVIAERWRSMFWRGYDFTLLAFGFTHGINGLRMVLRDYTAPRFRKPVFALLLALYVVLVGLGAWIIFTFQAS